MKLINDMASFLLNQDLRVKKNLFPEAVGMQTKTLVPGRGDHLVNCL